MKTMAIEWQRLVDKDGQTCDRCACTDVAIEAAFEQLKLCLAAVEIEVVLEKHTIDQATFALEPLQSNKISIGGKTIETWLGAITGQSPCCGPCGDRECRTISVDDQTYETIPDALILRAGLLAAAEKLK